MKTLLAVAFAGAIGSVARYAVGRYVQSVASLALPAGTLLVNVVGCLLVGIFARRFLNDHSDSVLRAALIVGLCGGFTTYSAFGLETYGLIAAGAWSRALAYALLTTVLCLASVAIGYRLPLWASHQG